MATIKADMTTVESEMLEGKALDWAVATSKKRTITGFLGGAVWVKGRHEDGTDLDGFDFVFNATDWVHACPIIESEGIEISILHDESSTKNNRSWNRGWTACLTVNDLEMSLHESQGHTALIAAMRCFVTSKLGKTIDVPSILLDSPKPTGMKP